MHPDGLIVCSSALGPAETLARLEAAVSARGMAILARIDHAASAAKVGLALRPSVVLIFGKPEAGTPLMQASQTIGIDLPLKALVWQDEQNRAWLGYNDPHWLADRHGVSEGHENILTTMSAVLAAIAKESTSDSTKN